MLRIATCQMTSGPDLGANLQIAESLIRKAAREGANLALLPEMFTIMSNRSERCSSCSRTLSGRPGTEDHGRPR